MDHRLLDDPAWFGSVMGIGATAAVFGTNPGQVELLQPVTRSIGVLLLIAAVAVLVLLTARDLLLRRYRVTTVSALAAPLRGPAYATIPGGINVVALALTRLFPDMLDHTAGMILIALLAAVGTIGGIALSVILFVSAFENSNFSAEDISGTWFIPESVIILGALLTVTMAGSATGQLRIGLTVVAIALLGAGSVLFAFMSALFINRLFLHAQVHEGRAAAMWIMISPLSLTAMGLDSISRSGGLVSEGATEAVTTSADLWGSMLWGFCMWWIVAAAAITRNVGPDALRFTPSAWAYVFPPAALALATVTLGRTWDASLFQVLAGLFSLMLLAVMLAVVVGSVRALTGAADHSGRTDSEHPAGG